MSTSVRENIGTYRGHNMVDFQNRGTPIQTQNTIVLIMGTPKKVPLFLGNPHMQGFPGPGAFAGANWCRL